MQVTLGVEKLSDVIPELVSKRKQLFRYRSFQTSGNVLIVTAEELVALCSAVRVSKLRGSEASRAFSIAGRLGAATMEFVSVDGIVDDPRLGWDGKIVGKSVREVLWRWVQRGWEVICVSGVGGKGDESWRTYEEHRRARALRGVFPGRAWHERVNGSIGAVPWPGADWCRRLVGCECMRVSSAAKAPRARLVCCEGTSEGGAAFLARSMMSERHEAAEEAERERPAAPVTVGAGAWFHGAGTFVVSRESGDRSKDREEKRTELLEGVFVGTLRGRILGQDCGRAGVVLMDTLVGSRGLVLDKEIWRRCIGGYLELAPLIFALIGTPSLTAAQQSSITAALERVSRAGSVRMVDGRLRCVGTEQQRRKPKHEFFNSVAAVSRIVAAVGSSSEDEILTALAQSARLADGDTAAIGGSVAASMAEIDHDFVTALEQVRIHTALQRSPHETSPSAPWYLQSSSTPERVATMTDDSWSPEDPIAPPASDAAVHIRRRIAAVLPPETSVHVTRRNGGLGIKLTALDLPIPPPSSTTTPMAWLAFFADLPTVEPIASVPPVYQAGTLALASFAHLRARAKMPMHLWQVAVTALALASTAPDPDKLPPAPEDERPEEDDDDDDFEEEAHSGKVDHRLKREDFEEEAHSGKVDLLQNKQESEEEPVAIARFPFSPRSLRFISEWRACLSSIVDAAEVLRASKICDTRLYLDVAYSWPAITFHTTYVAAESAFLAEQPSGDRTPPGIEQDADALTVLITNSKLDPEALRSPYHHLSDPDTPLDLVGVPKDQPWHREANSQAIEAANSTISQPHVARIAAKLIQATLAMLPPNSVCASSIYE